MGLNISREETDQAIRITVEGEVDLYTSPKLRSVIMDAMKAGEARIEVGLGDVNYMDSSGVATLVEGFKSAHEKGRAFALVSPSSSVMKVLELAKLDSVFTISRDS